MTARALSQSTLRPKAHNFLMLPMAPLVLLALAAGGFVSYVLWPTWKSVSAPLGAPELPITVAGVAFNVPTAAIRATVQRQPGPHDRVDLALAWPSLTAPPADTKTTFQTVVTDDPTQTAAPADAKDPLFVTIAASGAGMPPEQRLRAIYPHYVEAEALAGPDGLAILPFRAGTPYEGEDLIYLAGNPEQFFARCTRQLGSMPGTCMQERTIGAAEITLRFPRQWLADWRSVAARFDVLIGRLHPQANDSGLRTNDR